MNDIEMNEKFEANQADPQCPDSWVQWAGSYAVLVSSEGNNDLGMFSVDLPRLQEKIKSWCVKNGYRCSKLQNGKIIL